MPIGSALGDVSMTRTFSQEHDALDLPQGLNPEVKALAVSLTAKSGIKDFSFVRYLRMTMSDTSDNSNAVELINYERDDSAPASNVLNMTAANPVNALDKWKTEVRALHHRIAGTLPDNAWTADVTIRFAGNDPLRALSLARAALSRLARRTLLSRRLGPLPRRTAERVTR